MAYHVERICEILAFGCIQIKISYCVHVIWPGSRSLLNLINFNRQNPSLDVLLRRDEEEASTMHTR